ncbi:hypothetical protein LMG31506_05899 [Cupriavidus yeoncheonensis]|uniref:Uncharacterized protein n=1 Tax=Cupriavidus yeoncheonensis TaxID=1462994 RepID=A0A916N6Z1_9BURK|nr:hypothetical protein LMG31506_05899 [Cupriavidus yeoncheonensis]
MRASLRPTPGAHTREGPADGGCAPDGIAALARAGAFGPAHGMASAPGP